MKLSEVMRDVPPGYAPMVNEHGEWSCFVRIETNADSYYVISNKRTLQNYLDQYGDVEVEWDSEWQVYRVPAFRAEIEKYNAAKAEQCKIWGCE